MDEINLNPLTGLPANKKIKEKLINSISDSSLLVVYVYIRDFKPYNEVYGFTAGDNVILSYVRTKSAEALGELNDIKSMELLRRALKDKDNIVRKKAASVILKMAADIPVVAKKEN